MLGHTLKLIRLYNNISLESAAIQLNLWSKLLRKIESHKTKVSLSTLGSLSELYQMPISQILILNDKKEHLQMSDAEIWGEIQRFYVTKKEEPEEIEKRKKLEV